MNTGIEMIAAERERQITAEGYTAAHDDTHTLGQIAGAAAVYALHACGFSDPEWIEAKCPPVTGKVRVWPWADAYWKPSDDPVRNLVKAGALIAAEIDRLSRHNTMITHIAYCWASGRIQVGKNLPPGAIQLATGPRYRLRKAVDGLCRWAYDGKTRLVPGVPEASLMGYDPVQKAKEFSALLSRRFQP